MLATVLFCFGLVGLWKSSDWLVDSGSRIAAYYRLSPVIIGLSLVAFGTSAPELAISILASINQEPAIIWGNVLGSNIANTALILGVAGMITPLSFRSVQSNAALTYHTVVPIILSLLLILSPTLGPLSGLILFSVFGLFCWHLYKADKLSESIDPPDSITQTSLIFIASCLLLPAFAHLVTTQAINLATLLGVSSLFISLFLVSLGSSLPELVTCVTAAYKHKPDIILGNIIGSNIFNITLVLASGSLITPLVYTQSLLVDISLITALPILLYALAKTGQSITRLYGSAFLIIYVIYIGYRYSVL